MKTLKISETFEQALKFLWNGESESDLKGYKQVFICHCIQRVPNYNPETLFIIKAQLEGYLSLEGWLIKKNIVPLPQILSNHIKVQTTRKAWLESLVEEFKEKGL